MAARSLQVKKKISSRIWCVEKLFHKSLYFFFTTFHFFVVLRNRVDFLLCPSIERSYSQKKVAIMLSKRDWRNILPCETRKLSLLYIFLLLSVCDSKWRFSNERKTFFKKFVTLIWWNFFNSGRCAMLLLFFSSLWLRLWRSFSHATPLPTWWEELRNPSRKICSNYH